MNDPKKKTVIFLLMFAALLASFLVFVAALKGDSTLRIVLATGGFLGFAGLYAGLLFANKRKPSA